MSAPASAPAAAASSSATGTHANEPEGDCVLAIVDDLNRQLARWLDQYHDRARTCGTATELAFDADVSGLGKVERARLRRLLTAQGFSVMPGIMTYADSGDEQELFAVYRAIPAIGKREKDEQQQRTECCVCKAPATLDSVKLPTCGRVMCFDCFSHETHDSPDCLLYFGCLACHANFFFCDVRHLDGSVADADQPPPSKRQRTDATAASE